MLIFRLLGIVLLCLADPAGEQISGEKLQVLLQCYDRGEFDPISIQLWSVFDQSDQPEPRLSCFYLPDILERQSKFDVKGWLNDQLVRLNQETSRSIDTSTRVGSLRFDLRQIVENGDCDSAEIRFITTLLATSQSKEEEILCSKLLLTTVAMDSDCGLDLETRFQVLDLCGERQELSSWARICELSMLMEQEIPVKEKIESRLKWLAKMGCEDPFPFPDIHNQGVFPERINRVFAEEVVLEKNDLIHFLLQENLLFCASKRDELLLRILRRLVEIDLDPIWTDQIGGIRMSCEGLYGIKEAIQICTAHSDDNRESWLKCEKAVIRYNAHPDAVFGVRTRDSLGLIRELNHEGQLILDNVKKILP